MDETEYVKQAICVIKTLLFVYTKEETRSNLKKDFVRLEPFIGSSFSEFSNSDFGEVVKDLAYNHVHNYGGVLKDINIALNSVIDDLNAGRVEFTYNLLVKNIDLDLPERFLEDTLIDFRVLAEEIVEKGKTIKEVKNVIIDIYDKHRPFLTDQECRDNLHRCMEVSFPERLHKDITIDVDDMIEVWLTEDGVLQDPKIEDELVTVYKKYRKLLTPEEKKENRMTPAFRNYSYNDRE